MQYIYGKLNKETILTEYKGISTSTADIQIDNNNHTIKVHLIEPKNGLLFKESQLFTEEQLNQLYSNLKLENFASSHLILQNKENQVISGNLKVKGELNTDNNYLIINKDFNQNEAGILIKDSKNEKDIKIYINNENELRLSTGTIDQQILTKTEMDYNKFTIYNGRSLSTRDIIPNDINTENYIPEQAKDLVTKEYLEQALAALRQELNN